ncbi:hypothetical protein pdam_00010868 [Pocillopora damicornis]|uniref:RING-type domain-containing protein n=1 Tax=Pocillopora damicornis TaxID=46731 RepID=A0A3M6TM78_POCDA|nr:hypothetical protein pdam_00010868 [Pocillopora damicornis]
MRSPEGQGQSQQRNSAIQHCLPCYSSTGSTEPPLQREGGVTDNLPRITDQVERHGGAAASTSSCNDATDENRRNRECKVDPKSLKVSQEMKNKNQEYLSGRSHNARHGEFTGLKGRGKVPSFSNRGRSYGNRESVTYWNDKDAKPEEVRPQDDMRNTIDKKESNFFGIRPCFLARHSDDSCITTPIDDMGNTRENAIGGSSNTFSGNHGSPCLTNEQDYRATYSFQAPSFQSESSNVSAHAQGPNPYGSFDPNPAVGWDLQVPVRPLLSLPCNGSEHLKTLSCDERRIVVIPPHALINGYTPLAQTPLLPEQRKVEDQRSDPEVKQERKYDFKLMNGNPASLSNTTSITQGLVSPEMEISTLPRAATNRNLTWETRILVDQDTACQGPPSLSNCDSLADLELQVAETCSFVEKTLKKRQVKKKAMKEKERRKKEERARKEQQAREGREREASETRQTECRNDSEEVSNPKSGGRETPTQTSAGAEGRQWLCEHYKRLCRVKFPCCGKFFPCHRCHNNSGCSNDNSKAREACYVECSVCNHQQEINQDAQTCARCKTKLSAYFCSMCKHFTGTDKNPYHCTKCGICRIFKDRSFHCDVCNVCLDKRLEGRHSCRENSGHDECCICLEDAFSGCQILPCSHKVHRECAIAMIQNGVRSCPICRHPLYS